MLPGQNLKYLTQMCKARRSAHQFHPLPRPRFHRQNQLPKVLQPAQVCHQVRANPPANRLQFHLRKVPHYHPHPQLLLQKVLLKVRQFQLQFRPQNHPQLARQFPLARQNQPRSVHQRARAQVRQYPLQMHLGKKWFRMSHYALRGSVPARLHQPRYRQAHR